MGKDPAEKIKEIKPFGPQLPKDGPYKYRRPWQSWTGGDKVKKKNEFTTGGKTYKYAKGGRAGYKKAGSVKGCKMAKSGRGRAYGKNS
jgi:hypothetical protein